MNQRAIISFVLSFFIIALLGMLIGYFEFGSQIFNNRLLASRVWYYAIVVAVLYSAYPLLTFKKTFVLALLLAFAKIVFHKTLFLPLMFSTTCMSIGLFVITHWYITKIEPRYRLVKFFHFVYFGLAVALMDMILSFVGMLIMKNLSASLHYVQVNMFIGFLSGIGIGLGIQCWEWVKEKLIRAV